MTLPADEREHVLCDEADARINELEAEIERLRQALQECQNTGDAYVYRAAGNALAGRQWNHDGPSVDASSSDHP